MVSRWSLFGDLQQLWQAMLPCRTHQIQHAAYYCHRVYHIRGPVPCWKLFPRLAAHMPQHNEQHVLLGSWWVPACFASLPAPEELLHVWALCPGKEHLPDLHLAEQAGADLCSLPSPTHPSAGLPHQCQQTEYCIRSGFQCCPKRRHDSVPDARLCLGSVC